MGPIRVAPARSRRALLSLLLAGAAAAVPSLGSPVVAIAGARLLPPPRVSDSAGPLPPLPPRVRLIALLFPPVPVPVTGVAGPQAALGTAVALVPATARGSRICRLASRVAMRSSIAVRDCGAGSRAA